MVVSLRAADDLVLRCESGDGDNIDLAIVQRSTSDEEVAA